MTGATGTLRKGKEQYTELYPRAVALHDKGMPMKDIAKELKISYSAVYAWLKQGRRPDEPTLTRFHDYLKDNGPTAVADIKTAVPKHNDFYHISLKRNMGIKRVILDKRYMDYRVWYYLEGQEAVLEERLTDLRKKYVKIREKMKQALGV